MKFIAYPTGEMRVSEYDKFDQKTVTVKYGPGFFEELIAVLSLVEDNPIQFRHVRIPYVPFAREDKTYSVLDNSTGSKVNVRNTPLRMFANMLRSFHYPEKLVFFDVHSPVFEAHLHFDANFYTKTNLYAVSGDFREFLDPPSSDEKAIICIPDAGASKSVSALASVARLRTVQVLKQRNPDTGELSNFQLFGDVEGKRVVIVDDICDGGGTFIAIAKLLRENGASSVDLYTTHGIYSKNLDPLLTCINNIRCFDTINRGYLTPTNAFRQFRVDTDTYETV